jgi:hypothetical protein
MHETRPRDKVCHGLWFGGEMPAPPGESRSHTRHRNMTASSAKYPDALFSRVSLKLT